MKTLDLVAYGVKEMNEIQKIEVFGGGNFLDGVTDGCDGKCDYKRYAEDFWYTVGWGIGKTLRDQAM